MLTEICAYLHNWFDVDEFHKKLPHLVGHIYIENGHFADLPFIAKPNQYFYIQGSVFNDGVHQYTEDLILKDEAFIGTVQAMIIPPDLITLAAEIEAWAEKYSKVGSVALSPFNSESFGGYLYNKSNGGSATGNGADAADPVSVFAQRLNRWRKI